MLVCMIDPFIVSSFGGFSVTDSVSPIYQDISVEMAGILVLRVFPPQQSRGQDRSGWYLSLFNGLLPSSPDKYQRHTRRGRR